MGILKRVLFVFSVSILEVDFCAAAPGGVTAGLNLWLKGNAGTSTTTEGAATVSWTNQ